MDALLAGRIQGRQSKTKARTEVTPGYEIIASLARLLHDGEVHIALLNHLGRDLELLDTLLAG